MIREHPLNVTDSGLEKVVECMEEISAKKVSGKKLVVRLVG